MSAAAASLDPRNALVVEEFRHDRAVNCCAFDSSGQFLYAGAEDHFLHRWELATGAHATLQAHESWISGFACLPEGKLITAAYDGRLGWWSEGSDAPAEFTEAHQGWVRAITLSPDGKLVASCGNDRLVKVWSSGAGELVRELEGHASDVYSVAFHPGGRHLVSADHRGVIRQWDTGTWSPTRELDAAPLYTWHKGYRAAAGGVRKMSFSSDGRLLAGCGLTDATDTFGQVVHPVVALFDWESGKRVRLLRPGGDEYGVGWGVNFHPTEPFLVAVSGGRTARHVYFWRYEDEKPFHVLALESAARDLAIHPAGQLLAAACHDGAVRVIDLAPRNVRRF